MLYIFGGHSLEAEECDEREKRPKGLLHEDRRPKHVNLKAIMKVKKVGPRLCDPSQ